VKGSKGKDERRREEEGGKDERGRNVAEKMREEGRGWDNLYDLGK
jgi:hypothetical protein